MKVFTISDTHGFHNQITIPTGTDIIICAGDVTNYSERVRNEIEFNSFYDWWTNIEVKYKIFVPGNHDAFALRKYNKDLLKEVGYFLEHEYLELEGLTFFGSPYVPTFRNWYFMKSPHKLSRCWEYLVEGIDFLITHGPPKSILDISFDRFRKLEFCGDKALWNAVNRVNPKHHIFGHIHNMRGVQNYGLRKVSNLDTTFYNTSMVKDAHFDLGIVNSGHLITIKTK